MRTIDPILARSVLTKQTHNQPFSGSQREQRRQEPGFRQADVNFGAARKQASLFHKWMTAATLAVSAGGLFTVGGQARAEISPESARVVQWVQKAYTDKTGQPKAWKDMTPQNWNDVRVGLRVTDNTKELDLHPLRIRILKEGARSVDIPPEVVQEAIYTAGVLGSVVVDEDLGKSPYYKNSGLNANDLKKEISLLMLPYRDRVIVDTKASDGTKSRDFLSFSEASSRSSGEKGATMFDYRHTAINGIAKIGNGPILQEAVKALLTSGNNAEDRDALFSLIRQTSPVVKSPELEQKSLEWVFGVENLKKHFDAVEAKQKKEAAKTATPGAQAATPPGDAAKPASQTPGILPGDGKPNFVFTTGSGAVVAASKKIVGVIDSLSEVLKTPELPSVATGNRQHVANTIKYLAAVDHPLAMPAIAQWFNAQDFIKSGEGGEGNAVVLDALAIKAATNKDAFALLGRVAASHPMLFGDAYFTGQRELQASPLRDAGEHIAKAFKANPKEARQLINDLFNKKAVNVWPAAKTDDDIKSVEEMKDIGRRFATIIMTSDIKGSFVEQMRSLPENRFEPPMIRRAAIAALARARDTQSIDMLLNIGVNGLEDTSMRTMAMQAVMVIASPPELPAAVVEKASLQSPFSMSAGRYFLHRNATPKDKGLVFNEQANPFRQRVTERYNAWLAEQQKQQDNATENGRIPSPISGEQKLMKFQQIYKQEMGGANTKALVTKGQDKAFQEKYLKPLDTYLKSGKVDMELAMPIISLLGKARYQPSAEILHSMIRTPERYIKTEGGEDNMFSISGKAMNPALLRVNALEALGGIVDPGDKQADIFHLVLKDPILPYQFAALYGLQAMGESMTDKLADNTLDAKERERLVTAQNHHVDQAIGYLKRVQTGYQDIQQRRRVKDMVSYEAARVIDRLGGSEALHKLAHETRQKDPQSPLLRTIGQALYSNSFTDGNLESTDTKDTVIHPFSSKSYWGIDELHAKGETGAGGQHAHFDVGYINPVTKQLRDIVEYPQWIKWEDAANWEEPHPTGTAETVRQVAPGHKIIDYSVSERRPEDPNQPEVSQDSLNAGLEDLLQRQILPKGNPNRTEVTTTNHSYGYRNTVMYSKEVREKIIDLSSAYLQALGQTGVTNFVSAGNSQTDGPNGAYDPVGSVNTLGSRVDADGKVTKNDNTILVAAADGFLQWLAEFSSMPNPLRLDEALEMFDAPGYQEMTLYKNDNGKWERIPVDGTSFSSPNLAGLMQVANVARKNKGLPPWTDEQRREALTNASKVLPGREKWESGLYVDPLKLLMEAYKAAPVKK